MVQYVLYKFGTNLISYYFLIQITDIDDPPENIMLNYKSVYEGVSNVTIGIFTAKDPEEGPLTFQIDDTTNAFRVCSKHVVISVFSFSFCRCIRLH